VEAAEVTSGLAESNGSLQPGKWLKKSPAGSSPGPMLGSKYGKTVTFLSNEMRCSSMFLFGLTSTVDF